MAPRERGTTYGWPPREADRLATWRSVIAGFLLIAATFAAMVAVSHPVATALALATGVGVYALRGLLRRASYERTLERCGSRFCLQFCGPRVCLQFQLRVG